MAAASIELYRRCIAESIVSSRERYPLHPPVRTRRQLAARVGSNFKYETAAQEIGGYEDERLLVASGMHGTYAEQAAIVEFAKGCSLEPTAPELRFWSKTEVSEVDLVISNRGYHIPIEIKLGKTFDKRWLRGLDAFDEDHRRLGIEIPYRRLCHFRDPRQIDARTYALPLWLLA